MGESNGPGRRAAKSQALHDANGQPAPVAAATPAAEPLRFLSTPDFLAGDYRPTWLAAGAMVRGEPCVIAGPSKGLKSSLAVDLAVSLATGRPFLGHFRVPAPVRVALASAESGRSSLQATARRVCAARGVTADEVGDRLGWRFDVPRLSDLADVARWAESLDAAAADVFVLDPFYLSLGAVDAKNLFEVGGCLAGVSARLAAAGRTVVIVHHAGRVMTPGLPMELQHLAYSGLEQFARQFLLLNRRTPYRSDGRHELVLRAGGSAFTGGLFDVDADEGQTGDDFGGRQWAVTVTPHADATAVATADREAQKREAVRQQILGDRTMVLTAIDTLTEGGKAATVEAIRLEAGVRVEKAKTTLKALIEDGLAESYTAPPEGKRRVTATAFRRPSTAADGGLFAG